MKKRIKKPTVKSEQRQDWLRRYAAGESPPKIAERDNFDVRTVRRHIEEAKMEREVREARLTVLRNALEKHYADLCEHAERLDAEIVREEKISIALREDRKWAALRQHLPRSPLWAYLDKWDKLLEEIEMVQSSAESQLKKVIEANSRLKPILSAGEKGVIPGIVATLLFQMKNWPRGNQGLVLKESFIVEPITEKLVSVRYGFARMGDLNAEHTTIIKDVLKQIESKITSWEEYKGLQRLFGELNRLNKNLQDELAIITLRRIVPGRCRYCPI